MGISALVFPGQGSQEPGMGLDLSGQSAFYRRVLAEASRLAGVDLSLPLHLVTGGDADHNEPGRAKTNAVGRETITTQLSVFSLSVALGRALLDGGFLADTVAGHSLGELSALAVGGWLTVDDALELVALRAEAMARCCSHSPGSMVAVLGVDSTAVAPHLLGTDLVVANDNGPRQCVVSGPRSELDRLTPVMEGCGGTVIPLAVAGAFHSPLMQPAEAELTPHVESLRLRRGHTPLVSSITGGLVEDLEEYRAALSGQITRPVRWREVMTTLERRAGDDGQLVEVGPARVLRGLHRTVNRRRPVHPCSTWAHSLDLTAMTAAAPRQDGS